MRKNAFRLDKSQIKEIESERKRAQKQKKIKYDRRLRGLLLCGESGFSQQVAAEMIEMTLRPFQSIIRTYRNQGVAGIKVISPPGRPPSMSKDQEDELSGLLILGPEASGYDSGVWDWRTVQDLIVRHFKRKYSKSQIHRILHKIGFTVQYPTRRLHGADIALQQRWVHDTYSDVKKKQMKKEP